MRTSQFRQAIMALVFAVVATSSASGNLLSDFSFENAIDPLPGVGPVFGPPLSPGFWGASAGGEVPAERGITPFDLQHMLYMEKQGQTVTQTLQAVDVSAYATLIDAGQAVADLRAWINADLGHIGLQVFDGGLIFFAGPNTWPNSLGSLSWWQPLDTDPNTWEPFVADIPLMVGTRWIVVKLGYVDQFLPLGERAYVDAVSLRIVPEPATLTLLAAGLIARLRRRR